MNVQLRTLSTDVLQRVASAVVRWQAEPTQHIAYLSTDADAVAEELRDLEPVGLDGAVVAWRYGEPVGLIAAE